MICRYLLSSIVLHALVFILVSTNHNNGTKEDPNKPKTPEERLADIKNAIDKKAEADKKAAEKAMAAEAKATQMRKQEEKGKIVPKTVEVSIIEAPPKPPAPVEKETPKESEEKQIDIPKVDDKDSPIVKKTEKHKSKPAPKKHTAERSEISNKEAVQGVGECGRWYGGIGVTIDAKTLTIQEVTIGYPAYRAGIRVGDVMENGADDLQGDPGTAVTVGIYRRSIQREFILTITREKICVE